MGILGDYDKVEFKCAICGTDCVKVNSFEPEYGYQSKVDGSFVGPLCEKCKGEQQNLVVRKVLESAFIVGIQPDGEGIFLTEDGIDIDYKRSPTPFEIKAACNQIVEDLSASVAAQKTAGLVLNILSRQKVQEQSQAKKLFVPKLVK